MTVFDIMKEKHKYYIRFYSSRFVIVVHKETNEYHNIYANPLWLHNLEKQLELHPVCR